MSGAATGALVFALLGLTCLPLVGSLVAVSLGFVALGEIHRSAGALEGRGRALGGLVLGGLGALGAAGLVIVALWRLDRPPAHAGSRAPATATGPRARRAPPPLDAPPPALSLPKGAARPPGSTSPGPALSHELETVTTRLGTVTLVDPGVGQSLSQLLDAQGRLAQAAGEKLLLWVSEQQCRPCNGFAAALTDPQLQAALGPLRLIRVEASAVAVELRRMDVPTDKIPGFALLDPQGRTLDYVHGGEWDDDIAANIAPVMRAFLRGDTSKRRYPWQRPRRPDELPL